MQLSLSDEQTIEGLLENLPLDYQQTAIESKAFLRARKIRSPMELMHLVMMYCGVDQVLREVAGNVTLLNEKITDTAIQKRLRVCGPWLKMILEQMWFSDVTKLPGALRFVLVDGSSLSVKGADGTSYRLHIAIDLVSLGIIHIEVTNKYVGESLAHYPFIEGDVVIVDRGYNQPQKIIDITDKGILIVLRLNPYSMRLFSVGGEHKIKMYDELKKAKTDNIYIPVWVSNKDNDYVEAWVHARRLPLEKRAEARRQCKKRSKTGRPKQETLLYAEWQMVLTTVPPSIFETEMIGALYALRWQIEVFIKRLKSLLDIDKLRCPEGSTLNEVWLYGKLLFTTLLIKRTDKAFSIGGMEPKKPRKATPWRFWKTIRNEMKTIIVGVFFWKKANMLMAKKVMEERPRKRQLQCLPSLIEKLLLDFA